MSKYIDTKNLIANLKRQKHELELSIQSQGDYGQSCQIVAYDNILSIIEALQQEQPECIYGRTLEEREKSCKYCSARCEARIEQEQPKLTQVPRIEQETQKKGWMDYGLLINEIGLHRSNAIERIKEIKERAAEIKRNIAPHDLAILCEYLENVGAETVLCCLQQYCRDFMFTQDEVKEILQQEQSEVDLEKEIIRYQREDMDRDTTVGDVARHFYKFRLNTRKK